MYYVVSLFCLWFHVFITGFLFPMKHKSSLYRWIMSQRMTDCAQNSGWQSVTEIHSLLGHLQNTSKNQKNLKPDFFHSILLISGHPESSVLSCISLVQGRSLLGAVAEVLQLQGTVLKYPNICRPAGEKHCWVFLKILFEIHFTAYPDNQSLCFI